MTPNNPLRQYFRQPSIYVRLPSAGRFYPDGCLDLPPNGELPVLPMTAVDEITYRTPDALFNGSAVVNVIQSCIPNIRDAWQIPAMDVDTILVAIRIASYGHTMEFGTVCPKCGHEHTQGLDLRGVLERIKAPNYDETIKFADMEIFFKPMTYKNLNDNNQMQFEEQKILQMLPDVEVSDQQKIQSITDALSKITQITVKALSQSIGAVKTPNAVVTEPEFIQELLENCDRELFGRIRDHIVAIKQQAEMQPFDVECPECTNKYSQSITLDMASFFEPAS